MTETKKFKRDNRKFGGIIYQSDFETCRPNGNIATRIESDFYFDKKCKRNTELRDMARKDLKNEKTDI